MTSLISVKSIHLTVVAVFDVVDALVANNFFEDAVHQALVEGMWMASQVV